MEGIESETMTPSSQIDVGCCGAASGPVYSGTVHMLPMGHRGRGIRVIMSIYDKNYERYAVIAPDKVFCKACGYFNLKNILVKQISEVSFQLIPADCDASSLTFTVNSPAEMDTWLRALQTECEPKIPFPRQRSTSHPADVASLSRSLPSRLLPPSSFNERPKRRQRMRLSLPSLREERTLSDELTE